MTSDARHPGSAAASTNGAPVQGPTGAPSTPRFPQVGQPAEQAAEPAATSRRWRDMVPPGPIIATVLAVACAVVTWVPALHVDRWSWLVLGAGAVVALGLAAPAHVASARAALSGRWWAMPLASLGVLGVLAWAVATVASGDGARPVVAAAVAGALLVVTHHVRRRVGFGPGDGEAPRWFAPAVVAVAALAAVAAWGLGPAVPPVEVALAVVLASAPTALALAPAVALATARRRTSPRGIHLGGLGSLERLAAVEDVVLDQDGTVTTGHLAVVSIDPVEPEHDRNLRWFAGALSHAGEHPISRAVSKLSARGRVTAPELLDGRGMRGAVDRHPVRVGDPAWLGVPAEPSLWRTVAVEVDSKLLGTLTVAEEVRPDAEEQVQRLRDSGVDVHLVSRSTPQRASRVAQLAGLSEPSGSSVTAVCADLAGLGRQVAVASARPVTAPGVVPIAPGAEDVGGVGVVDPAVGRVAEAVTVARTAHASVRRGARLALGVSAAGALVAATGLLPVDVAALVGAAATGATATLAAR